jgi:hypothetical protein
MAAEPDAQRVKNETDVDRDDAQALTRVSGERANDTYVGRDEGQDVGYAGETGAERRQQESGDSGS